MLDFTSNYKKFLPQRNFFICVILLRRGTVMQFHVIEVYVAVLWGELCAVGK